MSKYRELIRFLLVVAIGVAGYKLMPDGVWWREIGAGLAFGITGIIWSNR